LLFVLILKGAFASSYPNLSTKLKLVVVSIVFQPISFNVRYSLYYRNDETAMCDTSLILRSAHRRVFTSAGSNWKLPWFQSARPLSLFA